MNTRLVRVAPLPATTDVEALKKLFADFNADQVEIIGNEGYLRLLDFDEGQ